MNPNSNSVIFLTLALGTAFPSPAPEYAAQPEAWMLLDPEASFSSDDDSLWTDESFAYSDAIAYDFLLASDANVEGLFSEAGHLSSLDSADELDGLYHDDWIASLDSADPLEDSCSANSFVPYIKLRRRRDTYCPSEASPPSLERPYIPPSPNEMNEYDPRVPINVPLFDLNQWDDFQCQSPLYWTHLCCDGPRGEWVERWEQYSYVENCLPCMGPFIPSTSLLAHFTPLLGFDTLSSPLISFRQSGNYNLRNLK
jgi:hypothetical protein